jgi:hypothetical protein
MWKWSIGSDAILCVARPAIANLKDTQSIASLR